MTALELNAEIYRAMGEIANDETLLAKVLKYVKGLAPARTADEIVDDIRSARTSNNIDIEL